MPRKLHNKNFRLLLFITSSLFGLLSTAWADSLPVLSPSSSEAKSYIIEPKNGATVPETFIVSFGLRGMGVSPAGIQKDNTGHHHLLIDTAVLPPLDTPLGGDVKHFGGGQTETTLTLSSGKHTLQLILADHQHMPHQPPVISEKITVTVQTKK